MPKPVLLQIGEITERMAQRVTADFEVVDLFNEPDRAACLAARGPEVLAVLTNGQLGVPADVMQALPNLKVVSCYGVGYDAIDAPALAAKGVLVAHTPDVLNDEVAVTALMLWFALSRRLLAADDWARSGRWEREGAFPLTRSVMNRTLGIVGFGRIGQTIAARAEAFGAHILYHARSPRDVAYTYCPDLVAMAAQSDVLIVITPGGPATRHLVNGSVIEALGPEGLLINVARGSVVDEAALVEALVAGKLGGAGLDVFEDEPRIPDALKRLENVVLTPHVGSATVETRKAMGDLVCDNLAAFLKEGRVLTPVPECKDMP